jgi:hypothetical protein
MLDTELSALYVNTINIVVTVRATTRACQADSGLRRRVRYAKLSMNLTHSDTNVQAIIMASRASTKVNSVSDLDTEACMGFRKRIKIIPARLIPRK